MAASADGPPQVDACAIADLARLEPHWRDLGGRAAEPNPFAESAFLIPATRHIALRDLTALCVWRGPDRERLDALAILRRPESPDDQSALARPDRFRGFCIGDEERLKHRPSARAFRTERTSVRARTHQKSRRRMARPAALIV